MEYQELRKLIEKYNAGQASSREKSLVEDWFESIKGKESSADDSKYEQLKMDIKTEINSHITSRQKKEPWIISIRIFVQWAAVVLITLGIGFYFYSNNTTRKYIENSAITKNSKDIQAGGNKATLTLADGSKIDLNKAENGIIVSQGNTIIEKAEEGQLVYNKSDTKSQSSQPGLNMISTPKGGQYQIILSDGTKVWLNATSSLKFPAKFTGRERNVELVGEAYFEVSKNAKSVFNVRVGGANVKVLGTHFNIMAYVNEATLQTTLAEGSVSVQSGGKSSILVPGQQASVDKSNNLKISEVDVEEITAWKNGYFHFNRDDIREIMKKFERWYDIDVIYEGDIPSDEFVGKIRRSVSLLEAIEMLSLTSVNFKIHGQKVIVSGSTK